MDNRKLIGLCKSLRKKDREAFLEKVAYRTYASFVGRIEEIAKEDEHCLSE